MVTDRGITMDFNEDNFNKLKETNADLTKQFDALKGNQEKLLSEAKLAKDAKRLADEEKENAIKKAAKDLEEKNLSDGNFEQLHKSAMDKLDLVTKEFNDLKSSSENSLIKSEATKLSAKLSDGDNVSLMSEFVTKRLKVDNNEVKVLDASGALTISTLEDLENEFKNDPKFSSLLKGNGSSGGGAGGSNNGGGAANNPWKKDTLNLTEQGKIVKENPTLAAQLKKAANG